MIKFISFFFSLISVSTMSAQTRFEYRHQQMGTQIELVFYAKDSIMADLVSKAVFGRIDELNNILSDYVEDSELSRLCRNAAADILVSKELYHILKESAAISRQTDGAFDITAAPVIRLWRKARESQSVPMESEVKIALQKVGYEQIMFKSGNRVRLKNKGMLLDVGGIGKGFAADEAMKLVTSFGITSALIDMGGDILVSDPPPDKQYWVLAFSFYNEAGQEVVQKVKLKNQAIATSGDLYQFFEIGDVRYSHIIDPKTGMALTNGIQVTVIAKNATDADGYASAFSVMGIEKMSPEVEKFNELKVFLVERSKLKYAQWSSHNFDNVTPKID